MQPARRDASRTRRAARLTPFATGALIRSSRESSMSAAHALDMTGCHVASQANTCGQFVAFSCAACRHRGCVSVGGQGLALLTVAAQRANPRETSALRLPSLLPPPLLHLLLRRRHLPSLLLLLHLFQASLASSYRSPHWLPIPAARRNILRGGYDSVRRRKSWKLATTSRIRL